MQAPVRHGLLSSHKCNRQKCTAGGLAHRVPHRWRWMAGQKHLRFPAQQVPQERMAGITSAAASGTPLQQRNAPPATEGMPSREKLTVSWAGAVPVLLQPAGTTGYTCLPAPYRVVAFSLGPMHSTMSMPFQIGSWEGIQKLGS
eukprot:1146110-Pelagomonas_calceolata.AAC.12